MKKIGHATPILTLAFAALLVIFHWYCYPRTIFDLNFGATYYILSIGVLSLLSLMILFGNGVLYFIFRNKKLSKKRTGTHLLLTVLGFAIILYLTSQAVYLISIDKWWWSSKIQMVFKVGIFLVLCSQIVLLFNLFKNHD